MQISLAVCAVRGEIPDMWHMNVNQAPWIIRAPHTLPVLSSAAQAGYNWIWWAASWSLLPSCWAQEIDNSVNSKLLVVCVCALFSGYTGFCFVSAHWLSHPKVHKMCPKSWEKNKKRRRMSVKTLQLQLYWATKRSIFMLTIFGAIAWQNTAQGGG